MWQIQFHICVQILDSHESKRIITIDPHLTKLYYKQKGFSFFDSQCILYTYRYMTWQQWHTLGMSGIQCKTEENTSLVMDRFCVKVSCPNLAQKQWWVSVHGNQVILHYLFYCVKSYTRYKNKIQYEYRIRYNREFYQTNTKYNTETNPILGHYDR